ncbi:MAG: hypothetical protein EOP09_18455, partial [Proteobacteria bacterium]
MKIHLALLTAISLSFTIAYAEVEDPAQRLDPTHLAKLNETLKLHYEATQETVRIRIEKDLTPTDQFTAKYVEWAPTTSEPNGSVYVEISPDSREFQLKAGIGVDA